MKIRNIVILFTVLMMAIYIAAVITINTTQINQVNVAEINHVVKTIEKEWTQGEVEKSGTIAEMSYRITLVADENYQALLFDGIKNRQTIMDLTTSDGRQEVLGKIIFLTNGSEEVVMKTNLLTIISFTFGIMLMMVYLVLGLVYTSVLRPFGVMKQFARKVADGDLEFRLPMDRGNYFGAFTESFDLMREELKRPDRENMRPISAKKSWWRNYPTILKHRWRPLRPFVSSWRSNWQL